MSKYNHVNVEFYYKGTTTQHLTFTEHCRRVSSSSYLGGRGVKISGRILTILTKDVVVVPSKMSSNSYANSNDSSLKCYKSQYRLQLINFILLP
jgi:hypothetical protein